MSWGRVGAGGALLLEAGTGEHAALHTSMQSGARLCPCTTTSQRSGRERESCSEAGTLEERLGIHPSSRIARSIVTLPVSATPSPPHVDARAPSAWHWLSPSLSLLARSPACPHAAHAHTFSCCPASMKQRS